MINVDLSNLGKDIDFKSFEQKVLEIDDAINNKTMAARLGISEDGVTVRLKHAYEKLGVGDRAGAIAVAIKRGIARPAGMV